VPDLVKGKKFVRNIKLTLQYDGTRYSGWQIQKNATSIQELVENAVTRITGAKTHVTASGRTDAGVHARAQVANFKTRHPISIERLQMALNSALPKDIVVTHIVEAALSFNAQHSAKSKIYRYTIVNNNFIDPFIRRFAAKVFFKLDLGCMRRSAGDLVGRHNFKAFQAVDDHERASVRTVKGISIKKEGDIIYIDIEADGFLYNMARNIAGTLVEIGRGKFPETRIKELLKTGKRNACGPTMPARGLCLMEVKY